MEVFPTYTLADLSQMTAGVIFRVRFEFSLQSRAEFLARLLRFALF